MKHPVPTVAAVHDLSGVGRCALTVAIPVISAMGLQVCPAPTACLSAHTGFAGSHRLETVDLSDYLARQLSAWNQMGLKFDCVYTGYLGSPRQAAVIGAFLEEQKQAVKLVDPVMGDDGRLYSGLTPEMIRAMSRLAGKATLITPNMTEYAALAGEEYSLRPRSAAEIEAMLGRLECPMAVITSVPFEGGLCNACRDEAGRVQILPFTPVARHYPGTGDIFASVLAAALTRGQSLAQGVALAADFVKYAISISAEVALDENYGVQLEAALPMLLEART